MPPQLGRKLVRNACESWQIQDGKLRTATPSREIGQRRLFKARVDCLHAPSLASPNGGNVASR